mmetsp:Transcript_11363/g.26219  ORF Transcript_11363/g.26219 Transcript_11363/m.26219 type:complete len:493 (-) Transcript_11363:95-1573(-)
MSLQPATGPAVDQSGVSVKNTFIHVDDGKIGRSESDGPLARTESDPTGRARALPRHPQKVQPPSTVLEEPAPTEAPAEESDDDSDDGMLQRTQAHLPGAPAFLPLSRHLRPDAAASSAQPGANESSSPFLHVKNTFLELADPEDASTPGGLQARAESDPTGRSLQAAVARPVQRPPLAVGTVEEGDAEDAANSEAGDDEDDPLERVSTYDPFSSSQSYPGLLPLPPPAMPPFMPPGYETPGFGDFPLPLHLAGLLNPFVGPDMQPLPPATASWEPPAGGEHHPAELQSASTAMGVSSDYPPMGCLHRFHKESTGFGQVSRDFRQFTKGQTYEGRLSVLSEAEVHKGGLHRYLMQFTSGELTKADGVGFVFAPRLPCTKNVQKIVSVFVNQSGRICMRVFGDIIKAQAHVTPLQIGDWIEVAVDLDKSVATFNVWPADPTSWAPIPRVSSTAEFHYGKKLAQANRTASKPVKLDMGHFACVVQNVGVTVTIGS